MSGRIAVVDAHNRFLRWEARRAIHEQRLVHRSIHVLVFDSQQRLLIQRRHRDKQTYPSHWDVSCAGHVEESDYLDGPDHELDTVYHETARRELAEELGVDAELTRLGCFGPVAGLHYEQIQLFRASSDGPFVLQSEEVEEIRLLSPEALHGLFEGGREPVTGILRHWALWLWRERLWRAPAGKNSLNL